MKKRKRNWSTINLQRRRDISTQTDSKKWKSNSKVRHGRHNVKIVTRLPTSNEPNRTNMNIDQYCRCNGVFELTKCVFIACHRPLDRRQIYGLMLTSDRNRKFDFAICLAGYCSYVAVECARVH